MSPNQLVGEIISHLAALLVVASMTACMITCEILLRRIRIRDAFSATFWNATAIACRVYLSIGMFFYVSFFMDGSHTETTWRYTLESIIFILYYVTLFTIVNLLWPLTMLFIFTLSGFDISSRDWMTHFLGPFLAGSFAGLLITRLLRRYPLGGLPSLPG